MSAQEWAVVAIVAGAGLYLARSVWRTWAGSRTGCGSGCGKCATPAEGAEGQRGRVPLKVV